MAIRVRKLARELHRSPDDVLRLLHELGYIRFRNPADMVGDPIAAKVRKKAADAPVLAPTRPIPGHARPKRPTGLMEQLVPGVVKKAADHRLQAMPQASSGTEARPTVDTSNAARAELQKGLARDRAALDQDRTSLERALNALAEAEQALATDRAQLEADKAAFEAVRSAQEEARAPAEVGLGDAPTDGCVPIETLLAERGLTGSDEAERAIGALASARRLGPLLRALVVADPEAFQRVLQHELVLVGGVPADALAAVATVSVSPERAEIPGASDVERLLDRIGELLLLNGVRRLTIVGLRPRLHPLLKARIDGRIDLSFRASSPKEAARPGELTAVWVRDGADTSHAPKPGVLRLGAAQVGGFLRALRDALANL